LPIWLYYVAGSIPGGLAWFLGEDKWFMYFIASIVGMGFSCCGVVVFRFSLSKMRHAQDTPTSQIRSAAQGYVELKGVLLQVDGQPLLEAPLTRTQCHWWSYTIQKKNGDNWSEIESGSSESDESLLCLVDETGQCWINPKGAVITEHITNTWNGRTSTPCAYNQPDASGNYRYSERLLLPNHPLYALGYFKTECGQHLLGEPRDGRPFILSGADEANVIAQGRLGVIIAPILILVGILILVAVCSILYSKLLALL